MTIIYKNVPFRFDSKLWASAVEFACKRHGIETIAELVEVNEVTLKGWIAQRYKDEFPHPSMHNFLKFCDLLDIDPGQFFTIQDA